VLNQERTVGNDYSIDVTLGMDLQAAMRSDDLNDTVNYAAVTWLVQEEMRQNSNLLEHVAGRILNRIHATWPQVQSAEIRIAKIAPPIEADVEQCAIRIAIQY
jgi:dihydroneopterin aldolase